MDRVKELLSNTEWQQMALEWSLKVVIALAIFVVGRWVAKKVTGTMRTVMTARELEVTLIAFLGNLVYA
ncbi:MAG: hypothetical protein HKN58_04930, partial [Xanthomonadales bacterium]|nr:hypothetical protein [Xanthomonadales bacterium]